MHAAFQFHEANPGMVCPANWRPGQKAVRPALFIFQSPSQLSLTPASALLGRQMKADAEGVKAYFN